MAKHLQHKCKNRVTQDQIWDRRLWNTGFFPLSSIVWSFEKESRGVREWAGRRSTLDQRRRLSGRSDFIWQGLPLCQRATPAFVWASAQEEAGLAFPCSQCCQHQDDSLWWGIQDILTVSVSTEAASWWRMSEESQTDKKQEWCPCVSLLRQIDGSDRQLCVCVFTQGHPVGAVVPNCYAHWEEVRERKKGGYRERELQNQLRFLIKPCANVPAPDCAFL